jgi:hypothetical protein
MAKIADAPPTGTIVLLTRLARAVFVPISVDLVGMNLRNLVTLAYLRDHSSVTQRGDDRGSVNGLKHGCPTSAQRLGGP